MPPHADHDDVLAERHLTVLHHALPCAGKRLGERGGVERNRRRLVEEAARVRLHVLGERAGPDIRGPVTSGRERMLAVVRVAEAALRADPAEPRRLADHLVARREALNPLADLRDRARGFVPGDERKRHVPADALDGLAVRRAKTAALDADHDLSETGPRHGHVLEHQRVEVFQDGGDHLYLLCARARASLA
jgi:hypothetical protein